MEDSSKNLDYLKLSELAKDWINAWNKGDINSLINHYSDNVVFYSSAAKRRWGVPDGKLSGIEALGNHFRKAFEEFPSMKVTFRKLLRGADGVLLVYERENGKMMADFVQFNDQGKVTEVRAFNES
ncbi:MAG TPA: nuclear transport factor 2 family protein [Puia sp.]|jgi:ketosteroid isomerase-like protein|nr:nuclear transport factor 2 family protein [Puia sp.]